MTPLSQFWPSFYSSIGVILWFKFVKVQLVYLEDLDILENILQVSFNSLTLKVAASLKQQAIIALPGYIVLVARRVNSCMKCELLFLFYIT